MYKFGSHLQEGNHIHIHLQAHCSNGQAQWQQMANILILPQVEQTEQMSNQQHL